MHLIVTAAIHPIRWDGTKGMEMDNIYSRVAAALELSYRLLIGKGNYSGTISLSHKEVIPLCRLRTGVNTEP